MSLGIDWVVWVKVTGSDGVMDGASDSVSRYSAVHVMEGGKTRCGAKVPGEDSRWGPLITGEDAWRLRNSPFRGRCTRGNPTGVRYLRVCSKCDPRD